MSDHRRDVSVLAVGAASLALLISPLAAVAQDDEAAASVSEACQAANLGDMLKNPGRLTLSTDNPAYPPVVGRRPVGRPRQRLGGQLSAVAVRAWRAAWPTR